MYCIVYNEVWKNNGGIMADFITGFITGGILVFWLLFYILVVRRSP